MACLNIRLKKEMEKEMKVSKNYCSICNGPFSARHRNPGNICDPCWLKIQQDDIELNIWRSTTLNTSQKEKDVPILTLRQDSDLPNL